MIKYLSRGWSLAAMLVLSPLEAASLVAGADAAQTKVVVAGPQYKAGGFHEWLFGVDYRPLWTTPVALPVLDLQTEAGGLTPTFRVGGLQTKGLALKGKDGRNYTFRGLDKDATALVEEELQGTIVESLLQDLMAAQHPGSEVVARGLLEAVGLPVPPWRLVVLPDDPALGQFQKDFAGAVGYFAQYPSAVSATNPGFEGITEIIDHLDLYKRLAAGGDQVDTQMLLKARLMDLYMGDWDRHRKQWRWAKFPGSPLWKPIPEDRDQAFCRYEGLVLSMGRGRDPRFGNFGPKYGKIVGLTTNGREQDRQLLAGFSREDYAQAAKALQAQLTDQAIEHAVGAMPEEWRQIDGARLSRDLKIRRDRLADEALTLYLYLAHHVDVYATDRPELFEAKRLPGGDMELTVRPLGPDGQPGPPSYQRVLHSEETGDVRLYALSADDRIVVTGGSGPIKVRAIAGSGNDVLDDRQGGGSRLSDSQGHDQVLPGPGTKKEDDHPYVPPPPPKNAPWIPPQDFGSKALFMPWISYSADVGLFVGGGYQKQVYGFRKDPFAHQQTIRAGWGFGQQSGRMDYAGVFHRENRSSYYAVYAYGSGVEVLRYFGLGNNTEETEPSDFYKVPENDFLLYPTMSWPFGKRSVFTVGPVMRYSVSKTEDDTLVNQTQPYGFGDFGQVGLHAVVSHDSRDNPQYPRRGAVLAVRGTLWPKAWALTSTFGEVDGNVNTYLSPTQWLTFALRGGGKKVWGDYPFRDAAYLGGGGLQKGALDEPGFNLRGFEARRFGGDASLYGNSDLRIRLGQMTLIVPAHFGILGLFDVGRVFLGGESSDTWHTSWGGGFWISFLNYRNTFSVYVAQSDEGNVFHFTGGFTF